MKDREAALTVKNLLEGLPDAEVAAHCTRALSEWRVEADALQPDSKDPLRQTAFDTFSVHGDLARRLVALLATRKGITSADAHRLKEVFIDEDALAQVWMRGFIEYLWWLERTGFAVVLQKERSYPVTFRMTARGSAFFRTPHPVVEEGQEQQPCARYECIASLGEGVYGDAWRARDTELNREVAVKFIRSIGASRKDVLDHARALARVTDPNIVAVHDVTTVLDPVTKRPTDAVIMELIDGPSLVEKLGEVLDRGEARRIGDAILSAVSAYHARGLVHLDLHDGNVIVGERAVKVIDPMYIETVALKSEATRVHQQQRELRRARDLLVDLLRSIDVDALAKFERETMKPTLELLESSFHTALQTEPVAEPGRADLGFAPGSVEPRARVKDTRTEVIAETYARIRRAHAAAIDLTNLMQMDPPDPVGRQAAEQSRDDAFRQRWEELREYFLANAVYLGTPLERLVDTYLSQVATAIVQWRSAARGGDRDPRGPDTWAQAFYGLKRIAETTLVEITNRMHQALGIADVDDDSSPRDSDGGSP